MNSVSPFVPNTTRISCMLHLFQAMMRAVRVGHLERLPWIVRSPHCSQPFRQFSSFKSPPSPGEGKEEQQKRNVFGSNSSADSQNPSKIILSDAPKLSKKQQQRHQQQLDPQKPVQRFKHSKQKEWSNPNKQHLQSSVFQTTQYSCRRRHHRHITLGGATTSVSAVASPDAHVPAMLKSMNASALLNPREFCASSAKSTHTHNVSRSINGTDAARRLLRGKRECLVAARKMINAFSPLMLSGHNVPPQLLQHFINMGFHLLQHYGPDAEECSFHNYHHEGKTGNNNIGKSNDNNNNVSLPLHVRVRQRDSTNACLPPPAAYDSRIYDNGFFIDWDHHLELYLTVMQNFANPLGKIFDFTGAPPPTNNNGKGHDDENASSSQRATNNSRPPPIDKYDFENDADGYDLAASPLLFDSPPPRWNVDILRGKYYDLQLVPPMDMDHDNTMVGTVTDKRVRRNDQHGSMDDTSYFSANNELQAAAAAAATVIPPFPIVEFLQETSKASGHVLIRLQGIPAPSHYFGTDSGRPPPPQPVTLVFDAGYYRIPSMAFKEH
jgi:hypothetical protein